MGYANGDYAWSPADWARFPKAVHVTIDTNGNDPGADVLDVEVGDATPEHAPSWAKLHRELHPDGPLPVLYCNRSTLTRLFNAMAANGLHIGTDFLIGIATLDGTKRVDDMTGVAFVQYAGESQTGAHYDESIVYMDSWKPSATAPTPPPGGTGSKAVTRPTSPPGDYLEGTFIGLSTNGKLYRTDWHSSSGSWSPFVQES